MVDMNASSRPTFQRFAYSSMRQSYGAVQIDCSATSSALSVYLIKEDGEAVPVDGSQYLFEEGYVRINDLDAFTARYGTEYEYVFLERTDPLTQTATFTNGRYLDVRKVEGALDDLSRQIQDVAGNIAGTLKTPVAEAGVLDMRIPSAGTRSGMVLAFDGDGKFTTPFSVEWVKGSIQRILTTEALTKSNVERVEELRQETEGYSTSAAASKASAQTYAEQAQSQVAVVQQKAQEALQTLDDWHVKAYDRVIGDGRKTYTVTHGLNSTAIVVQLWPTTSTALPPYTIEKISANTIQIDFESSIPDDSAQVVVQSNLYNRTQVGVASVDWNDIVNVSLMSPEEMKAILEA